MKALLLAATAIGALVSGAQAYTVTSDNKLPIHGTSPIPVSFTPVVNTNQTTSIPNVERSPYEGTAFYGTTNGQYTSIEGTGAATFDFAQVRGRANTALTLLWGSPDSYNRLEIYSGLNGTGTLLATIFGDTAGITPYDGATRLPTGPSMGFSDVKISGLDSFQSIKLYNSPGDNAFEVSSISAVPLPASAPLFGAALVLMGGYGFFKRKRPTTSLA